jgi:hypothetical protein
VRVSHHAAVNQPRRVRVAHDGPALVADVPLRHLHRPVHRLVRHVGEGLGIGLGRQLPLDPALHGRGDCLCGVHPRHARVRALRRAALVQVVVVAGPDGVLEVVAGGGVEAAVVVEAAAGLKGAGGGAAVWRVWWCGGVAASVMYASPCRRAPH